MTSLGVHDFSREGRAVNLSSADSVQSVAAAVYGKAPEFGKFLERRRRVCVCVCVRGDPKGVE